MCAGINLYIMQHAKYFDFKIKVKATRITFNFSKQSTVCAPVVSGVSKVRLVMVTCDGSHSNNNFLA